MRAHFVDTILNSTHIRQVYTSLTYALSLLFSHVTITLKILLLEVPSFPNTKILVQRLAYFQAKEQQSKLFSSPYKSVSFKLFKRLAT